MASGIVRVAKQSGLLLATVIMVFQLAGCGDKEAGQSKAFSDFLQNTVMRSGSQLPTLSENQKKASAILPAIMQSSMVSPSN